MASPFIVGVDFDGTLVSHEFPAIGPEVPGCFGWLRRYQEQGARLILWTMRSDGHPRTGLYEWVLTDAIKACRMKGIEFWAVNSNPEQCSWTSSPKLYCHKLIDDANACCPLVYPHKGRPYVDWSVVGPAVMHDILEHNGSAA